MKKNKYLTFTRETFNLTGDMKFIHQIWEVEDNQTNFLAFIDNLIEISKKDKSYINVYNLTDYAPYLFKVAFIKQGELYTL